MQSKLGSVFHRNRVIGGQLPMWSIAFVPVKLRRVRRATMPIEMKR